MGLWTKGGKRTVEATRLYILDIMGQVLAKGDLIGFRHAARALDQFERSAGLRP